MDDLVREALRYLGVKNADGETLGAAEQAARDVRAICRPRYVYRLFAVARGDDALALPDGNVILPGRMARTMLADCGEAVALICTLGAQFDRELMMAQARDMARAVLLDACGSAYVEEGCDRAEKEIAARCPGLFLTDRFSPGYGDLPLNVQPALLRAVDGERRLGVTVKDSCMLSPVKTVTAVIGLARRPQPARLRGCAHCSMQNSCAYRERGSTCDISC